MFFFAVQRRQEGDVEGEAAGTEECLDGGGETPPQGQQGRHQIQKEEAELHQEEVEESTEKEEKCE